MNDRNSEHSDNDSGEAGYLGGAARRQLLVRGTQSLTALAAGGLLSNRAVNATPIRDKQDIAIVDRLSITVVTDSYHHAFEPKIQNSAIEVRRTGFDVAPNREPTRTLQSEWGLSLHVESALKLETKRLLIDFGYTPYTLLNNLSILGIDVRQLDSLALSHGHVDHFGGLAGFLAANKGLLRKGMPLFIGGEECFCARELVVPGNAGYFGVMDRASIRDAGLTVTFAEAPSIIADHGFTTGAIALRSFERVLAPTLMLPGIRDGSGCEVGALAEAKQRTETPPDDFVHEIATAYHVKGRGLVVMTSCGHRGVVNSVLAAIEASGVNKVLAVMGGFHLAPYPAEYQQKTAEALLALNPEFLIPMHCSGEHFINILNSNMPKRFIRSSTGSRFTFNS
jgi:7,8-dihydropterin-6-yl-methyl-4-(beta-D-ribofuranosyl)aminobenzene 5'-phosphate synthase